MLLLLYEALRSQFGIIVAVNDAEFVRQQFYAVRRKAGDKDLDGVSIVVSPTNPNELWLVRNGKTKQSTPA